MGAARCAAIAGLLTALAGTAWGEEFTVLSYNTHGLAGWVARDEPERRLPVIGRLSNAYDVALLQEDFAHHDRLMQGARKAIVRRGNSNRRRWCPTCSGSGLTLLSGFSPAALLEIVNVPYTTCSGWLTGANDCLASKGFQRARLQLPGGGIVEFVNTHLDAGRRESDGEARRRQLDQLGEAIRRNAGERALILGGDLNLDASDDRDAALLRRFATGLGLLDSGARGRPEGGWPILDYLLYRSGPALLLEVVESGEDVRFALDGAPLSDHPALFARFRATRREARDR